MALEFQSRKRIKTDLNITPLIDIIFLLLLFFMLTAQFIKQPGIEIDLPQATNSQLQNKEKVFISITEAGQIYLGQQRVKLRDLSDTLKSRLNSNKELQLTINADNRAEVGLMVKVIDIARKLKINNLVISTKESAE
jgi:biopolymer transport protein ExbD